MARIIRKAEDNLEEMLKDLKIGQTVLDSETGYDITKVPNGFIYKNEYIGLVFVPDFPKEEIKVVKAEPKKTKRTTSRKVNETLEQVKNGKPSETL